MKVVTFGEIMARLAPSGTLRFRQALPGSLHMTFAGAEANVAVSLSMLAAQGEIETEFVTALPSDVLADACVTTLHGMGVGSRHIVRGDGRLGLYFLETGANQRPSQVIYDRAGSAVSITDPACYDWPAILTDANWFHVTGITPAISRRAADSTLAAVRCARQADVRVSCDLNYRSKLWGWSDAFPSPRELAQNTMREILPFVDVLIANEADCGDVLGIRAADSDVDAGKLEFTRYPDVARQVAAQFPNLSHIAITLRESFSASHNNWGGMLYVTQTDNALFAPCDEAGQYRPYEIKNIVDRVGAGDSFAAGLIYALLDPDLGAVATAIRFAAAASCLAHSIRGDFNFSSRAEVETLMRGSGTGRVLR